MLLKAAGHFEEYLPALKRSFSRNYYRYERIYTNDFYIKPANLKSILAMITKDGMEIERERWVGILRWFHGALREKLREHPHMHWLSKDGLVGLIVDGAVPVNRVTLKFPTSGRLPRSIAWDTDGDGRLSPKDMKIPFRVMENQLVLDAAWTANRVLLSRKTTIENPLLSFSNSKMITVPTQFQLVSDRNLLPVTVRAANLLTDEEFTVVPDNTIGNTPSRRNIPVIKKEQKPTEVWSDDRVVEGVHKIDWPVKILPGTTLRMRPGASLIFQNRVLVKGTQKAPVRVISDIPGEFWGTVALHGPNTSESVLSHLVIENGSGAFVDNIRYIGMLSVHEARNVEFRNLILRKNSKFDDMMHIVYSEDIRLLGCVFQKAFSDGLDVDISTVHIQGCRISDSGNDAVDLMDSKALIMASDLSHSGDKGVSVGEGSKALIYNSNLHHNVNGVESKDRSVVYIINSELVENKHQINAYKKNWRYGSGGKVVADKLFFSSVDNFIEGDKKSDIKIFDSAFSTGFGKKDRQVLIDPLSDHSGERKAASAEYQPITAKVLKDWGIEGNADRRGMLR